MGMISDQKSIDALRRVRKHNPQERTGATKKPETSSVVNKIENVLFTYRQTLDYYRELLDQYEEGSPDVVNNEDTIKEYEEKLRAYQKQYEDSLKECQIGYEEKLTGYQNGYEDKLKEYQKEYTSKLEEYQQGYTDKIAEYQNGYTEKLIDYQEGYTQRFQEYQSKYMQTLEEFKIQVAAVESLVHEMKLEKNTNQVVAKVVADENLSKGMDEVATTSEFLTNSYAMNPPEDEVFNIYGTMAKEESSFLPGNMSVADVSYLEELFEKYSKVIDEYKVELQSYTQRENPEDMLMEFKQALAYYKDCLRQYEIKLESIHEESPSEENSAVVVHDLGQIANDIAYVKGALEGLTRNMNELTETASSLTTAASIIDKAVENAAEISTEQAAPVEESPKSVYDFSFENQGLEPQVINSSNEEEWKEIRRKLDDLIKFVGKLDGSIVECLKIHTSNNLNIVLNCLNEMRESNTRSVKGLKSLIVFNFLFSIINIGALIFIVLILMGFIKI